MPGPGVTAGPYTNEATLFLWDDIVADFTANGYTTETLKVFLFDGVVCANVNDMAAQLATDVDALLAATGAEKVDIVGHSMAALTTRVYLANGGDAKVDDLVLLAGTPHGSDIAGAGEGWQDAIGAPAYEGAMQMYPPYACEGDGILDDTQFELNGCLTADGRSVERDEHPYPTVDLLSIWANNDEVNVPQHSSCLKQEFFGDCSDPVNLEVTHITAEEREECAGPCPIHAVVLFDDFVINTTREFLSGN